MRVQLLLFILCAGGAAALSIMPGWQDLALIAAVAAAASLVLLVMPGGRKERDDNPRHIIVDGSNVMYWRDNTPDIATLIAVVDHLIALGYSPGVVFDANAGYLVAGAYRHDGAFGHMLGLPQDRVFVVPKGMVADGYILAAARDGGHPIVSNDRYRDWLDQYPEIHAPGRLIRGGWRNGRPWVELDAFAPVRQAA